MFVSAVARKSHSRTVPVIGVTGSIGSGKSTVARMFASWGAVVVSGDEVGHWVVDHSPTIRRRLARDFGADIFEDGHTDRRLLAQRAFMSEASVLKLNAIVHPELIRELNRRVETARSQTKTPPRAVVIDAALLVEWGLGRIHWRYLVGVTAPYALRLERLRSRGLTLAQIRRFARAQLPWSVKRTYCDAVVKNDSSMSILRRRARLCWDNLLSSAGRTTSEMEEQYPDAQSAPTKSL